MKVGEGLAVKVNGAVIHFSPEVLENSAECFGIGREMPLNYKNYSSHCDFLEREIGKVADAIVGGKKRQEVFSLNFRFSLWVSEEDEIDYDVHSAGMTPSTEKTTKVENYRGY